LYCLNDLHKASGNENKNKPSYWLQTKQAKEYIELLNGGIPAFNSVDQSKNSCFEVIQGKHGGTYASKELVYSYAMWISVKFHHAVIHTYDAVVTGQLQISQSDTEMLRLTRISPNTLKAITGNRSNNEVRKGYIGLTQGGYLVDAGKWVWKHNYQPTEKGLECVKAVKHGILHFKPEYHEALMETVANYTEQLTCDNTDLFLDSSLSHSKSD